MTQLTLFPEQTQNNWGFENKLKPLNKLTEYQLRMLALELEYIKTYGKVPTWTIFR